MLELVELVSAGSSSNSFNNIITSKEDIDNPTANFYTPDGSLNANQRERGNHYGTQTEN